jgi:DNA-binding MarR family transcriptional regulator
MRKDLQVVDSATTGATPTAPATARDDGAASAATDRVATSAAGAPERTATPDDLDPLERRAWRAFLVSHARLGRVLEAEMLARSGMPLAEFDVLFQINAADGRQLRMNELAERVLLSRAGITRLVDRLVEDGLVARVKCPSDLRGSFAVITDTGRERLEAARPGHLSDVKRHFLDSFSRAELEEMAALLGREFPL